MSIKTTASILVHDAGQLTLVIVPVSDTGNVLLRLADGADAPIVLVDTPAALLGLLTRALAAVGSVVAAERESLIETLDILSDDDTMAALAEAEREDVALICEPDIITAGSSQPNTCAGSAPLSDFLAEHATDGGPFDSRFEDD